MHFRMIRQGVLLAVIAVGCDGTFSPPSRGVDTPVDGSIGTLCPPDFCGEHGMCVVMADSPMCVCETGYVLTAPRSCEPTTMSLCTGVDCSGHGRCERATGVARCICDAGYMSTPLGTGCLPRVGPDPCASIACGEGRCVNVDGSAACTCNMGFHAEGLRCVPDTMTTPCSGVVCSGHGMCEVAGVSAVCRCEAGYAARGTECVPDTSTVCSGVACSGHGTCSPVAGRPVCTCDAGYMVSGTNCIPSGGPDPCASMTCNGHGRCVSEGTSAVCVCDPGYYASRSADNCQAVPVGHVCEGRACGQGTCVDRVVIPLAYCACAPGYVEYFSRCVERDRFYCFDAMTGAWEPRGVARCQADDVTIEVCRDADGDGRVEWAESGTCGGGTLCSNTCLTTPCDMVPCPTGQACVYGERGRDFPPFCAPSCNCRNCGNCGPGQIPAMGRAACGNTSGETPTIVCDDPCEPGYYCIPWPEGNGICWNNQGCESAPPS
jgi:EGF-like domain